MADDPNTTVLLEYDGVKVQERTRRSGKKHVSMSIESTPILVHHDPAALGKPVAEAIKEAIIAGIKRIPSTVSQEARKKREQAARSFAKGARWATKAYAGGRTGATPPNQSDREYNSSGRLANGIFVSAVPASSEFVVNAPVNRLNPAFFRDGAAFERMFRRLVDLVPAIRNPLAERTVVDAIEKTWKASHQALSSRVAGERAALGRRAVLEGLRLVRSALGA